MKTGPVSLIAVGAALAVTAGIATLTVPADDGGPGPAAPAAARLPVKQATLLCPAPGETGTGETTYTSFTPGEEDEDGSAELHSAVTGSGSGEGGDEDKNEDGDNNEDKGDGGKGEDDEAAEPKPVAALEKPGAPVTATTDKADAPALVGSADGGLAPGWSVQQTTLVSGGDGRGLAGASCTAPDTDLWFAGPSAADERRDYVQLTNPDSEPAVVDLELYDKDGPVESETGDGIQVPAGSSTSVLLSTLVGESADPPVNVAVHVAVRSGRVGAAVHATDEELGNDWIQPVGRPGPGVVLPGIPADATSVRLVAFTPAEDDADLDVKLATPDGSITPAGSESLHVKSGMTTAVDLEDLTQGEAGSLILEPADGSTAPVVAGLRVTRGKGGKQEMAFIPGTSPVEERTTAGGNWAKGAELSLTAPGKAAKVRVTASAGSEGGEPAEQTYTVKAGSTLAVEPPEPDGAKGRFALTVERLSGGEVYAARTLTTERGGIPMFTVQTLPDDEGRVEVPDARQDLGVLTD